MALVSFVKKKYFELWQAELTKNVSYGTLVVSTDIYTNISSTCGFSNILIFILQKVIKIFFYFQVSWIRQREINGIVRPVILTTGLFTYTSDQRFSVLQRPTMEYSSLSPALDHSLTDWVLQIKFVQPRDAGVYECQVSTEPRISENFHLNVVGKEIYNKFPWLKIKKSFNKIFTKYNCFECFHNHT